MTYNVFSGTLNLTQQHLARAATRTHQQGGGDLHQVSDCLHGCQWWSVQASAVTPSISKSASSSQHKKPALFKATHIPEKTTVETLKTRNFSQGSAAALRRWGEQINNFCVAYYLIILWAKYCRNRSTCVDTTVNEQGIVFRVTIYVSRHNEAREFLCQLPMTTRDACALTGVIPSVPRVPSEQS